jgi:hypothetical protein
MMNKMIIHQNLESEAHKPLFLTKIKKLVSRKYWIQNQNLPLLKIKIHSKDKKSIKMKNNLKTKYIIKI